MNRRTVTIALLELLAGLGLGLVLAPHGAGPGWFGVPGEESAGNAGEPLYWVAPMDPNYRRDGPGKSPMGMDLVPVYAEDARGRRGDADGVRIAPEVAHNFGLRLAEVERAVLDESLTTLGRVALAEPLITHVHPRVRGWIERLAVRAQGDPVRAGDVLMELYAPDIARAQEEYLLARDSGDAQLAAASRTRLRALGFSAEQVARIDAGGALPERIAITAESDGFVMALNVREGMFVEPGTEMMAIAVLDPVWVIAELFEHQLGAAFVGQSATIRIDALPDLEIQGDVEFIYPVLDEAQRTLRVRMRVAKPAGRLRPGMFGEVRLSAAPTPPTLVIPRAALIPGVGEGPDRVVVALGDDRYDARPVRAGRRAGDRVEILEGLEAGVRVVVSGQFLIDSESSVDAELRRMGAAASGPDQAGMDDSETDDSETDDSETDHSGMDHSDMDHSEAGAGEDARPTGRSERAPADSRR